MGRVAGVALAIAQPVGVECLRCRGGKIACTFEQRYAVSWRFCPRGRPTLVGTAREIGTTLKIGQARLCPPFRTARAHADKAAPSDLNLSAQRAAATDGPDSSGASSPAMAGDSTTFGRPGASRRRFRSG